MLCKPLVKVKLQQSDFWNVGLTDAQSLFNQIFNYALPLHDAMSNNYDWVSPVHSVAQPHKNLLTARYSYCACKHTDWWHKHDSDLKGQCKIRGIWMLIYTIKKCLYDIKKTTYRMHNYMHDCLILYNVTAMHNWIFDRLNMHCASPCSIHNIASSSEKVVWSESGEKSAQIKQCLQAKTALNKYVTGFWCERQQKMHFFTRGSVIMNYGLIFWPEATVKI